MKKTLKEFMEIHRWFWNDLNWFGKIAFYWLLIVLSPLLILIIMGSKKNE